MATRNLIKPEEVLEAAEHVEGMAYICGDSQAPGREAHVCRMSYDRPGHAVSMSLCKVELNAPTFIISTIFDIN